MDISNPLTHHEAKQLKFDQWIHWFISTYLPNLSPDHAFSVERQAIEGSIDRHIGIDQLIEYWILMPGWSQVKLRALLNRASFDVKGILGVLNQEAIKMATRLDKMENA